MEFKNVMNNVVLGLVTLIVSFSASAQVKWDMYAFSGVRLSRLECSRAVLYQWK